METLPVSLIVKTIFRPNKLKNFLFSLGEYEEIRGIHFTEVLVGDDSPEEVQAENKSVVLEARDKYPHLNIKYYEYEFDIGLSAGRNRLVQVSSQPFILVCDDDNIFDMDCDLRIPFSQLLEGGYDLIGGWYKNQNNIKSDYFSYWGQIGYFVFLPDEWIIYINNNSEDTPEIAEADYVQNFFIAKSDVLHETPWDEELKNAEHRNFFKSIRSRNYKVFFSKKMFIRHDVNRATNPQSYNEKRSGEERYKYYTLKSVVNAGFAKCTINQWRKNGFGKWELDAVRQTTTHTYIEYKEPILAQRVPVARLTPRYRNYSSGCHEPTAASHDGRYALCQSVPAMNRLPTPGDIAQLGSIDAQDPGKVTHFAATTAWCHRQGAHLQFIGKSNKVIFNVFDEAKRRLAARVLDLETRVGRDLPCPVSAVSSDGKLAASLNFARLYDYSPGYGYGHLHDAFAGHLAPPEDGLRLVDLESGDTWLELSCEAIRNLLAPTAAFPERNEKWLINQAAFSPDGNKILILARTFSSGKPYPGYTLVYDRNAKRLNKIFGFSSHCHWKDNDAVFLYGSPFAHQQAEATGPSTMYEVSATDPEYTAVAPDDLLGDGHYSYSPDRSFLVYGSYADVNFPYSKLQVFDVHARRLLDLGYFFSESKFYGDNVDLRCDLHPRWSPDGNSVHFDSIHEGFRAVYAISTADIQNAFASDIAYFPEQELRRWYEVKYTLPEEAKEAEEKKNAILKKRLANKLFCFLLDPFLSEGNKKIIRENPLLFFTTAKHPLPRLIWLLLKR